ncbi:MAG: hypothetical protein JWP80_632 [Pseudomonas sp.]|nr:hypothetical protein [Pseudomonas sp.]
MMLDVLASSQASLLPQIDVFTGFEPGRPFVGAGLPAKAVDQAMVMLYVMPSSQASLLPQNSYRSESHACSIAASAFNTIDRFNAAASVPSRSA